MNTKYTPLDSWLKDCEICNVGLCKRIIDMKHEGKSTRREARIMEVESDGLWDADKIRNRYRYYKQGRGGSKRPTQNTHPKTPAKPAYKSEVVLLEIGTTACTATEPQTKPVTEHKPPTPRYPSEKRTRSNDSMKSAEPS